MSIASEPIKAQLFCLEDSSLTLELPYNPKEFSITRTSGFQKKDKGGGPWGGVQWSCAQPDALKFDIVLDVSMPEAGLAGAAALMFPISSQASRSGMDDTRSVLEEIMVLHNMTIPRWIDPKKAYKRPPFVAFLWGDFQFFGAIDSIDSKCVLFDFRGIPKRAEVSISMLGQAFNAPKDPGELTGAIDNYKYKSLAWKDPNYKPTMDPRRAAFGASDAAGQSSSIQALLSARNR